MLMVLTLSVPQTMTVVNKTASISLILKILTLQSVTVLHSKSITLQKSIVVLFVQEDL